MKAPVRLLLQAMLHDAAKSRRKGGLDLLDFRRIVAQDSMQGLYRRCRVEGAIATDVWTTVTLMDGSSKVNEARRAPQLQPAGGTAVTTT